MGDTKALVPAELIETKIYLIRGQKVILDSDLAELYSVATKRLNEQVKRNKERFPEDFMFQLTSEEAAVWGRSRSQIATLKRGENIKYLPYAFTKHGAIMAANVLNSPRAIEMRVFIVRAFIRTRDLLHRIISGEVGVRVICVNKSPLRLYLNSRFCRPCCRGEATGCALAQKFLLKY